VAEMPDELYRTIMDVNLTSTFWMCRAALVRMLR
jgi:NAD(P)-dependent dehydrogenase (short-subunit alcohol dehydrogenase family)